MLRFTFGLPIFHIFPDPAEPLLGVELRDKEQHYAGFQVVSPADIEAPDTPLPARFDLPWWSHPLGIFNGILLAHLFGDPGIPVPTALQAYRISDGSLAWERPGLVWIRTDGSAVTVRNDRFEEQTIGLFSGEPAQPQASAGQPLAHAHFPEGHPELYSLHRLVRLCTGQQAVGPVDYLEIPGLIVISFYFYASEKLKNSLLVVNHSGDVVLHEELSAASGSGYSTFLYWRDSLVFIQDQVHLCCYAVS